MGLRGLDRMARLSNALPIRGGGGPCAASACYHACSKPVRFHAPKESHVHAWLQRNHGIGPAPGAKCRCPRLHVVGGRVDPIRDRPRRELRAAVEATASLRFGDDPAVVRGPLVCLDNVGSCDHARHVTLRSRVRARLPRRVIVRATPAVAGCGRRVTFPPSHNVMPALRPARVIRA